MKIENGKYLATDTVCVLSWSVLLERIEFFMNNIKYRKNGTLKIPRHTRGIWMAEC